MFCVQIIKIHHVTICKIKKKNHQRLTSSLERFKSNQVPKYFLVFISKPNIEVYLCCLKYMNLKTQIFFFLFLAWSIHEMEKREFVFCFSKFRYYEMKEMSLLEPLCKYLEKEKARSMIYGSQKQQEDLVRLFIRLCQILVVLGDTGYRVCQK